MKKILTLFFALTVIFTFPGCSNSATNNVHTPSATSPISESKSAVENNTNQKDSTKEMTTEKRMNSMNITVGNMTFIATLEDNDTAKAFVAQLPLTVDMSELNGNEKYNYLSSNLRADTSSCPGTINEGDLMFYGDNCLILFYKTFKTSYSYVKLGHIDNTAGLDKALGSGNVQVAFSVSN